MGNGGQTILLMDGGVALFWIVINSFWSNRRKYRFFMIALALSALVSSLGLSGVSLMAKMWRMPMLTAFGGHLLIQNGGSSAGSMPEPFVQTEVVRIVQGIFPEATITSSLVVPAKPLTNNLIWTGVFAVMGRAGGLDTWYVNFASRSGSSLAKLDPAEDELLVLDRSQEGRKFTDQEQLLLAQYDASKASWSFANATQLQPEIVGTLKHPACNALTRLDTLQRLSGTPTDVVSQIGVALPSFGAEIPTDNVEQLRAALLERWPKLQVTSLDEYAKSKSLDLVPLHDSTQRFIPIILGLGLMVVVATTLAVADSRQRELSLMWVIGMSVPQVWLLFTLEAVLAASMACCLGYAAAKLVGFALFMSPTGGSFLGTSMTLMPFIFSFVAALLVGALVSLWAVTHSLTGSLRNA